VVYSDEYAENLGVRNRYGFTGKIICLSRGACAHWAHPHSVSRLVRGSMRLLPDKYKAVTATVDPALGEIGVIYQACGFVYVGAMRSGRRAAISVNGAPMSEQLVFDISGTRGARALARLGFEAPSTAYRERYFAFRGSRRALVTALSSQPSAVSASRVV
jgi:hypothetical protein